MSYYDDLSAASSVDHDDDSSSDDDGLPDDHEDRLDPATLQNLWDRSILHLDVDCFYCQCEEIDRGLRQMKPPRPLAIGQKHIIVTCNYEARKYGVKKLELRESAMLACPDLWIVEGSDLQHYRRHSRAIYEAFRQALQDLASSLHIIDNLIPARKGTMDEMMADLSPAVQKIMEMDKTRDFAINENDPSLFVFGDTRHSSNKTVLVEDQTGQEAVVAWTGTKVHSNLPESRRNIHDSFGTSRDRQDCMQRLRVAAGLTARICRHVEDTTGFSTTGGVSVSPLLAKLCSGLQKPKSVNLLYPWRSSCLMYPMPLRKMHNVGHKTSKALGGSLANGKAVQTVHDLLDLPRDEIVRAFGGLQAFQAASEECCDNLIEKCRGIDTDDIVDDEGGLPKTVSVENSFRRGTVRSMDGVWRGLDDLVARLPKLLQDRTSWATNPEMTYPTTIRLTIRVVDKRITDKRRPFVTRSKQAPINGKSLLEKQDLENQAAEFKRQITPLLRELMTPIEAKTINVTRMNIAVTNFLDIPKTTPRFTSNSSPLMAMFQPARQSITRVESSTPASPLEENGRFEARVSSTALPTSSRKSHTYYGNKRSFGPTALSQSSSMKTTRIDQFFSRKKP